MSSDIVTRVGKHLNEKIVNIQKIRKEKGKSFMSRGKLENMIVKHNSWRIIRRDLEGLE